jgi:hypothetical protein
MMPGTKRKPSRINDVLVRKERPLSLRFCTESDSWWLMPAEMPGSVGWRATL